MPRISVILPVRDAAPYLPAAIGSLQAQTLPDYEVLAVDDGSTDGSRRILEEWAAHDHRVRILTDPADDDPRLGVLGRAAGGLVAALRRGLGSAAGELVARMDADDVAEPERFELQTALLDERPEVVACGTHVRYFPADVVRDGARRYERWINSLAEPAELERDIFVECPIAHPALMGRRDALRAVGGYRVCDWPEDYDLVLRLWEAGHRFANVPRVLHRWRERPDRASRTDPRYSPESFRRLKVDVLKRTLLRGRDGVILWGAGPVGKAFARELLRQGVTVRAFVELDPRKIGQEIHGAPVIAPDEVDRFRRALALPAVGSPGARSEIRAELDSRGWVEMEDYCAVA